MRYILGRLPENLPETARLTAQLIAIESTDPGTYEAAIEGFIKQWVIKHCSFKLAGHSFPLIQELEALPGRTCLRAILPATCADGDTDSRPAGDKTSPAACSVASDSKSLSPSYLTFICHMDTVTDGDSWDPETPAFTPVYKSGLLYGRGSCDMKGGLACALLAFRDACQAAARTGSLPKKSLSVIFTVDEEADMRGVEHAIDAGWLGEKGWVLDAEPTNNCIRGSHKGRTWFKITVDGITAHASTPWEGADAIAALAVVINEIRTGIQALPNHPELGRSTVTFGQVKGGYQPYVVPDKAELWIDMRLVPPANTRTAEKIVQAALSSAEEQVSGVHAHYDITGNRPPVVLPAESELLAAVRSCAQACGTPAGLAVFTGYTDTAVIASTCKNTDCLSYGPGELERAHKPNEYVPVADLERVYHVFRELTSRLSDDTTASD